MSFDIPHPESPGTDLPSDPGCALPRPGYADRAPLLDLISRYKPVDAQDAAALAALESFVRDNERCFERSLEIGHVTGSAWLVNPTGDKVLLTHHRKLSAWLQLGGHADGEGDITKVAAREAEEESGIPGAALVSAEILDIDVHPIPARGSEPAHFHYDVRFALRAKCEDFVVSEESNSLQWVRMEELEKFTQSRSMLRMRDKWLELEKRLRAIELPS